ncbi:MAG TPA: glycosyltransferase family 1 protein [Thermoanaerobaculia bacterium]|nr:glycosyltransferase family 1 protein [Thermoanaerobaculia bacterium]
MILATLRLIVHTLGHALAGRIARAFRSTARGEQKLRIGVDIRPFYEPLTGVGWYLYHLLHELARRDDVELVLFGDARMTDEGPHLHCDLPEGSQLCAFDLRGQPKSRFARPLTAAAYVVWMALLDCDVFFAANYFLPRLMGAVALRRVIVVHDLTYKRFPELLQKETLDSLERQMSREIALADAIVCVSESTRHDLLAYYQADPHRVHAIHSGIATPPQSAPLVGLPPHYILFVSTIEPRKNLSVLLDAFAAVQSDYDGWLVVAGKIGWKSEDIAPRLHAPRIMHLDYVPAPELATAYAHADLFVFPSLYEGFGFPLLEAMSLGVPSIAARSSSLPEIGGDAALYFDPHDAGELASLVRRVLRDDTLRRDLVARGRERAAQFRWDAAAEKTLKVLRDACAS